MTTDRRAAELTMRDDPAIRASLDRRGTYLFVLPWSLEAIGGVNQVVRSLYAGAEKFGLLEPRIMENAWEATAPVDRIDEAGRRITAFRIRILLDSGSWIASLLRYLIHVPLELYRLRRLVERYDVRVVNCHYLGGADFTWVLARKLGVFTGKVLLSMHGLDVRTGARTTGVKRWLWRWMLRNADAVVACSEGLAEETMRDFGLTARQVVTIHNGVDSRRLNDLAGLPGPPFGDAGAGGPLVLNIGTFEHKKGQDVLVRAFALVAQRHPTARLKIMGRDGEMRAVVQALIEELGLTDRVSVLTNVPHAAVLRTLGTADVFVLSSRNEAFCVALLEAGALARPVVATDVCGVPELIHPGATGVLVPSEDPAALATGMLEMLQDRDRATECGRRLRELVSSKFTQEATSRSYLALAGCLAADSPVHAAGSAPAPERAEDAA